MHLRGIILTMHDLFPFDSVASLSDPAPEQAEPWCRVPLGDE